MPAKHSMFQIPHGKSVSDFLPAFAHVSEFTAPMGTPSPVCPSCEKPFNALRRRRLGLRLYPDRLAVPVAVVYHLCGRCTGRYRAGGFGRDAVLTAIQTFMIGKE